MITVILKVTHSCNLNCEYCSVGTKSGHMYISEEVLTSSLAYIGAYVKKIGTTAANIILHGGEPTLVPAEYYENAFRKLKESYPDIDFSISMQTNGFNISNRLIRFLKEYNVNVGVSLDGGQELHDAVRKSASGQGTFDKITANIQALLSEGIPISCLMVLSKAAMEKPLSYLEFFEKHNLPIKINPLLNYGEAVKHPELFLNAGDYADYLIKVFEYSILNDLSIPISPINQIVTSILMKKNAKECTFCGGCSNEFICIDYDGDIYPCGKFSDMKKFRLGTINSEPGVVNKEIKQFLLSRRTCNLPDKCRTCKFLNLCNAGCTAEAAIQGNIEEVTPLCEDYQKLFSYFSSDGLLLLREKLALEKKEREKILNELRNTFN